MSEVRVHRVWRQRRAQLLLRPYRIVALGDADAVGDAEHVAIDRQPRHAERMAEHDVRGLAADAGQRGQRVHVGRHLAAVLLDERLRHADERLRLLRERSRWSESAARARAVVAFASVRAFG